MSGTAQVVVTAMLLAVFGLSVWRARQSGGGGELWLALGSVALMADTFVIKRARVLTIPLFFVVVLILLFWSARRGANREDVEDAGRS